MSANKWFFHGEYQPSRHISHKSKREPVSTTSSKDSLIAHTQKERQARQLLHQQKITCVSIQAYIRRYLAKSKLSKLCNDILSQKSIKSQDDWDQVVTIFSWLKTFYMNDKETLVKLIRVTVKLLVSSLSNDMAFIEHSILSTKLISLMEDCAIYWEHDIRLFRGFFEYVSKMAPRSFRSRLVGSESLCDSCANNNLEYWTWYTMKLLIPASEDSSSTLIIGRFNSATFKSELLFENCLKSDELVNIIGLYMRLLSCVDTQLVFGELKEYDKASLRRLSLFLFNVLKTESTSSSFDPVLELQLSILHAFKMDHGKIVSSTHHLSMLYEFLDPKFLVLSKIISTCSTTESKKLCLKFILVIYFILGKNRAFDFIMNLLMIEPKTPIPLLITWGMDLFEDCDDALVLSLVCILIQQHLMIVTDLEVQEKLGAFLARFCISVREKITIYIQDKNSYASAMWFFLLRPVDIAHTMSQFLWKIYFVDERISFLSSDYWVISHQAFEKYIGYAKNGSLQASMLQELKLWASHLLDQDGQDTSFVPSIAMDDSTRTFLMLLLLVPFAIPFDIRAQLLQCFIKHDKDCYSSFRDWFNPPIQVDVRRGFEFEDGYKKLFRISLHGRIQVTFLDELGLQEAGIDGGGLFKEFISRVFQHGFSQKFGLFRQIGQDNTLCPTCSQSSLEPISLFHYEFLGSLVGKALYENILLDAGFSLVFLKKWIGFSGSLEDLKLLDKEFHRNLLFVKECHDVESLNLTFTTYIPGAKYDKELVPGGKTLPVTRTNRFNYIYAMAHDILNVQLEMQTKAFLKGFHGLIKSSWMEMFTPAELQVLISGTQKDVDWVDWMHNTVYNGYEQEDRAIKYFWAVVRELTQEELSLLLLFSTGCSRPPLFGFGELQPRFCISNPRFDGNVDQRLPSVNACSNILHLPNYSSKDVARERIIYAIKSNTGFHLA